VVRQKQRGALFGPRAIPALRLRSNHHQVAGIAVPVKQRITGVSVAGIVVLRHPTAQQVRVDAVRKCGRQERIVRKALEDERSRRRLGRLGPTDLGLGSYTSGRAKTRGAGTAQRATATIKINMLDAITTNYRRPLAPVCRGDVEIRPPGSTNFPCLRFVDRLPAHKRQPLGHPTSQVRRVPGSRNSGTRLSLHALDRQRLATKSAPGANPGGCFFRCANDR